MSDGKKGLAARLDGTAFARGHAEFWTFLKFTAVSVFSAGIELGAQLAALAAFKAAGVSRLPHFFFFDALAKSTQLREGYTLAMVVYAFMVSTAVGYAVGFFINRKSTFHADSNIALSTFLYVLLVIFTIFANSLVGPAIEGFLPGLGFLPEGLTPALAKVLSMLATALWVYPANRFIIHRKKKEAGNG
jgi:putative flippase GtrA